MNVLHVLSQYETNGAETYAAVLADEQIERGYKATIVSDSFHTPAKAEIIEYPIGKRDYLQRLKNIWFLMHVIKERGIDIVNAHSRAASWVSYFATRSTGTPLVSTIHMRQHLHLSTRKIPVYGEKLIAVCEAVYEHLQRDLNYGTDHLALVRNGINLDRWEYRPYRETKKDRKIIAVVGRFSGFKGDTLVSLIEKIFPEVIRRYPEIDIQIVGGMSDQEMIIRAAEKFNAQAGKRFIVIDGFSRNVQEVYRRADLVIGSGRVAMEALACGSLVVSVGESNLVGLLTKKTEHLALATNLGDLDVRKPISVEKSVMEILSALRNPGIVSPEWGRSFIADYFNVKNIIQELDLIYTSLIH